MLRDVLGAFLDTATEREFDAPLLALLESRGFKDVHFLHGAFEFGKDFIAKQSKEVYRNQGEGDKASWTPHQYSIQSKAGNLGLHAWQQVRLQIDSARLTSISHPNFDANLPRVGVLVTTGRLTGAAPAEAQSYRVSEQAAGRPDFELWDRETLLAWMAENPDLGLTGRSAGAILSIAGAIDESSITLDDLELFSRSWLPPAPGGVQAAVVTDDALRNQQLRALVEAAVLVNRLRISERLDLAAYVALQLLRSAWAAAFLREEATYARPPAASAAVRLFVGVSSQLLSELEATVDDQRLLLAALRQDPLTPAAYPVACLRMAEVIGLLGLLAEAGSDDAGIDELLPSPERIDHVVRALIFDQPGTLRPVSDNFAVCLLAPVIFLAKRGVELGPSLTRAAVYLADHYDRKRDSIGLSEVGASPEAEIERLQGGRYEGDPARRSASFIATVLLDLCAVVTGLRALYEEFLNEFKAVDISPTKDIADERVAVWRPDGSRIKHVPRVGFREPLPTTNFASIEHEDEGSVPLKLTWDCLALASVVRSRYSVANLRFLLYPSDS